MDTSLLSIGRFAQLTGLSIRMLRRYDQDGLLSPEQVDESSRYRRYAVAQLDRGGWIARLRSVDMPLEEIRSFLDEPADHDAILARHRERLADRVTETTSALHTIDTMMRDLAQPELRPHRLTAMVVKGLQDQPVLRIRRRGKPQDCDPAADIDEVFHIVNHQRLRQAGPPYYSASEPDEDGCCTVESGIPVDLPAQSEGAVEADRITGGDVASLLYRGPYDGIGAAYRQLWREIVDHGFTAVGDHRDSYVTRPAATPDPDDYLTEVIWPITS